MATLSNLDLIRRVSLFTLLTTEQAARLSLVVTKRRLRSGTVLVEQGKESNKLYIILAGRAFAIMTDDNAREAIVATYAPGDYVGEMGLLANAPHSATVRTDRQADVLELDRDAFIQCLNENIGMSHAIMQVLAQRLQRANEKISTLALAGVYKRVASSLLELTMTDELGRNIIREKVSRQNVAKMVGASREMVSRVMNDFERNGFIQLLDNGMMQIIERRSSSR